MFADQPTSGTRVFSGTVVHIVAVALLLGIVQLLPEKVYESILPNRIEDIVYLVDPGPGGGVGAATRALSLPSKPR